MLLYIDSEIGETIEELNRMIVEGDQKILTVTIAIMKEAYDHSLRKIGQRFKIGLSARQILNTGEYAFIGREVGEITFSVTDVTMKEYFRIRSTGEGPQEILGSIQFGEQQFACAILLEECRVSVEAFDEKTFVSFNRLTFVQEKPGSHYVATLS